MMKIAVVDDDTKWRECICQALIRLDKNKEMEIDEYSNGKRFLLSKKQYDISFIDIEMPGLDGFKTIRMAQKANSDGIYIILTTHVEMSRKGYLVNAFRYIDKTKLGEIKEALRAAKILLGRNEQIEVNVVNSGQQKVTLKNIIYIETEKHYILIHTRQGVLRCSNSLKEIESMLPENCFSRCHKTYIVNLDEISHMDKKNAYLSNGDGIQVSQRKMSQFKKSYVNRQFECANK